MAKLTEEMIVTIAKFKDRKLESIPAKWLLWYYDNGLGDQEVIDYIDKNRADLEDVVKKHGSMKKKRLKNK